MAQRPAAHSGLSAPWRNLEIRKHIIFKMGLLASELHLCPGEIHYLYPTGQETNLPPAWRKLLSLSLPRLFAL